jgi:chitinase
VPAGKDKYSLIELNKIGASVDWVNVMAYDFHGPWDTRTNFQSNLHTSVKDWSQPRYGIDTVVKGYLAAGLPKNKLVVGMPFYSHGWTGVTNVNHGLYQNATGAAPGTWEAGTDDYKVLKAKLEQGLFQRYWDNKSQAAWLFDGTTFWTYDDAYTAALKTTYVREKSLRGVMFWELSGDDGSLVNAIAGAMYP